MSAPLIELETQDFTAAFADAAGCGCRGRWAIDQPAVQPLEGCAMAAAIPGGSHGRSPTTAPHWLALTAAQDVVNGVDKLAAMFAQTAHYAADERQRPVERLVDGAVATLPASMTTFCACMPASAAAGRCGPPAGACRGSCRVRVANGIRTVSHGGSGCAQFVDALLRARRHGDGIAVRDQRPLPRPRMRRSCHAMVRRLRTLEMDAALAVRVRIVRTSRSVHSESR